MTRRTRLQHYRRRPSYMAGRGVLVLVLCLAAAIVALRSYDGVPLKDYSTLVAEVPDVGNLREHDPVRVAGVRVGQVQKLISTDKGAARVELQMEPSAPPVPVDSTVAIRSAGLLGARFVELRLGRSPSVADGRVTLRGGAFAKTYGVSEALEVFDRQTRRGTSKTIDGLSVGLLGNARGLNDAVRLATPEQAPYHALTGAVLAHPDAVDRFVPSTAAMMRTLDDAKEGIARLLRPAAQSIRPFDLERTSVNRAVSVAPGALDELDRGLSSGRELLAATRALSTATTRSLRRAPAALDATTRLLATSARPYDRGAALLDDVQPAVPDTLRLTRSVRPLLQPVSQAVTDLVPLADLVGQHRCDIENFGAVFRSMTGVAVPGPGAPLGMFRLHLTPSPYESLGLNAEGTGTAIRDPYSKPCAFTGPASTTALIEPIRPTSTRGAR